jgi:hypothetical protein
LDQSRKVVTAYIADRLEAAVATAAAVFREDAPARDWIDQFLWVTGNALKGDGRLLMPARQCSNWRAEGVEPHEKLNPN